MLAGYNSASRNLGSKFVYSDMQFFLGYCRLFDRLKVKGSVRGLSLAVKYRNSQALRVGVVIRRSPGSTRWAAWTWQAVAVLPGAADADWKVLREEGGITEFHAATREVTLYVSDTEAYVHELGTQQPSLYVVLRESADGSDKPLDVVHITASPYEGQDYADSGEEIVEKIPMPPAVLAWVEDFVTQFHVEEPFVKRRRDKARTDRRDDGVGDARIMQATDVYRAPRKRNREAAE